MNCPLIGVKCVTQESQPKTKKRALSYENMRSKLMALIVKVDPGILESETSVPLSKITA